MTFSEGGNGSICSVQYKRFAFFLSLFFLRQRSDQTRVGSPVIAGASLCKVWAFVPRLEPSQLFHFLHTVLEKKQSTKHVGESCLVLPCCERLIGWAWRVSSDCVQGRFSPKHKLCFIWQERWWFILERGATAQDHETLGLPLYAYRGSLFTGWMTYTKFTKFSGHEQKLNRYNQTVTPSSLKCEYIGNRLQFFFHDGRFSEENTKIYRNLHEYERNLKFEKVQYLIFLPLRSLLVPGYFCLKSHEDTSYYNKQYKQ